MRAENHKVVHPDAGTMPGYGALAKAASQLPTPPLASIKLTEVMVDGLIGNMAGEMGSTCAMLPRRGQYFRKRFM